MSNLEFVAIAQDFLDNAPIANQFAVVVAKIKEKLELFAYDCEKIKTETVDSVLCIAVDYVGCRYKSLSEHSRAILYSILLFLLGQQVHEKYRSFEVMTASCKRYKEMELPSAETMVGVSQANAQSNEATIEGGRSRLLKFANWMALSMRIMRPNRNKGKLLECVARLSEGRQHRHYVTGSSPGKDTANRVTIFEVESETIPASRPGRWKVSYIDRFLSAKHFSSSPVCTNRKPSSPKSQSRVDSLVDLSLSSLKLSDKRLREKATPETKKCLKRLAMGNFKSETDISLQDTSQKANKKVRSRSSEESDQFVNLTIITNKNTSIRSDQDASLGNLFQVMKITSSFSNDLIVGNSYLDESPNQFAFSQTPSLEHYYVDDNEDKLDMDGIDVDEDLNLIKSLSMGVKDGPTSPFLNTLLIDDDYAEILIDLQSKSFLNDIRGLKKVQEKKFGVIQSDCRESMTIDAASSSSSSFTSSAAVEDDSGNLTDTNSQTDSDDLFCGSQISRAVDNIILAEQEDEKDELDVTRTPSSRNRRGRGERSHRRRRRSGSRSDNCQDERRTRPRQFDG